MSDISKLTINNSTYDLKDAIARLGTTYYIEGSGSSSGVWKGSNPDIPSELYSGLRVAFKADIASANNITLQLNGGTAHAVKALASTNLSTRYPIGSILDLIYDATGDGVWKVCDYSVTDNDKIGYQLRTNSQTMPVTGTTYRYRILFTSADGKHYVPANTGTSTNATARRDVCQDPIDPFGPIYVYGTTGTIAAGGKPGATYLWQQYAGTATTLGYSFNRTGAALTLTPSEPVYIKCAPQTDGSAIIDATIPYVQELPTTEDGKIYILLGIAYGTENTTTQIELLMKHPVYEFKNGKIQLYTGASEASVQSVVGKTVTLSTSEQAAIQVNGTDSGSVKLPSDIPSTWLGTSSTTAAAGNHTHGISLASDTGTSTISLGYGSKYKLTAGGSSTIFTTPSLGTSSTTAAAGNHTHGNISNAGTMTDTAAAPAGNDYILTRDADNAKVQTSTIKATDAADAVSKKHSHTDITLSTTAQAYDGTHTIKLPATSPWGNALTYRGVTTTALSDGTTTNPITINGSSYTAVTGDVVLYKPTGSNTEEYIFDGTTWQLFGSVDADDLGDLAFGDTITIPAKYAKLAFSGSDSNLLKANSTPSPSQVLTSASIPANSVVTNGTTTKYILSNATTVTGGETRYLSVKCDDLILTNPSSAQIVTDDVGKDGYTDVLNGGTTSYLTGSATGGAVGSASGTVGVLTGASAKRLTASSSNVITAGTTQYFHPSASGGAVGASTETGVNAYTSNTPKYKSATTTSVAVQTHTHPAPTITISESSTSTDGPAYVKELTKNSSALGVTLTGSTSTSTGAQAYISGLTSGSAAAQGHTHGAPTITLSSATSTSTGAVSYISGLTKNASALSVSLDGSASSGVSYISGVTKNASALSVTINGNASSGTDYLTAGTSGSAASAGHTHSAPTITLNTATSTSTGAQAYISSVGSNVGVPSGAFIQQGTTNYYTLDLSALTVSSTTSYMSGTSSTIAATTGTTSVITGVTSKKMSASLAANSVVTAGTTKKMSASLAANSVVTAGTTSYMSGTSSTIAATTSGSQSVITAGTTKYMTASLAANSVVTAGTTKYMKGTSSAIGSTTTTGTDAHTGWSSEGTTGTLMSSITFGTTATAAKSHTHSFTQPTISLSPNGTASGGTAYISGLTSGAPTITLTGTTALTTDGVAYVESVDLGSAAAVGHTHSFTQPSVNLSSGSTSSTGAIPYISGVTSTQVASAHHTHDIIASEEGFRVITGFDTSGLAITLDDSTTQTAGSVAFVAELSSGTHTHSFTQNNSGTSFVTGITKNSSAIDVSGNKTYAATWASQPTLDRGAASGSITASTGTSGDYTIVFGQEGTYGPDSN